jgi:hypothetical protein
MTLTRLLEINLRLIQPLEYASISFAERTWQENGSPTGVRELIDLLEKVLSGCQKAGERYAPILLQRKRALQRGTWVPPEECLAAVSQTSGKAANSLYEPEQAPVCVHAMPGKINE